MPTISHVRRTYPSQLVSWPQTLAKQIDRQTAGAAECQQKIGSNVLFHSVLAKLKLTKSAEKQE